MSSRKLSALCFVGRLRKRSCARSYKVDSNFVNGKKQRVVPFHRSSVKGGRASAGAYQRRGHSKPGGQSAWAEDRSLTVYTESNSAAGMLKLNPEGALWHRPNSKLLEKES